MTRMLPAVVGADHPALARREELVVGVLPGEGVGPALTDAAVRVLRATAARHDLRVEVVGGPPVERTGLSGAVTGFLQDVFDRGGAVLAGAVSGRFVYDLRRDFDLYCKLVPVRPWEALERSSPFRPGHVRDVDLVVVRENVGGIYQGSGRRSGADDRAVVQHTFGYTAAEVRRIVRAGAELAASRRGRLAIVVKDGGLPEMSALWREVTAEVCEPLALRPTFLDVDLCAYELLRAPAELDVLVAPNLFGDVLADLSALLLGGRGISYSGNYSPTGAAVYQTNHGAAFDLTDADAANPVGQMSAAAMLLRESAGEPAAADAVLAAIDSVWRAGWRTLDLARPGDRVLGTEDFTTRVVDAIETSGPGRDT